MALSLAATLFELVLARDYQEGPVNDGFYSEVQ